MLYVKQGFPRLVDELKHELYQPILTLFGLGLVNRAEFDFLTYHSVEEIYQWLRKMEKIHNQNMKLIKIGTSHEVAGRC